MSHDDYLSDTELRALTSTTRPARQAAKLAALGLPFEYTPTRVRVRRMLAAAHGLLSPQQASGEPRLDLARR